jgi:Fe-Mn family superoxide dismutase
MLCNIGDTVAAVAAASMLRFNAGGHVNHSIFWQNLAPKGKTGEPSGGSRVIFMEIYS